MLRAIVAAPGGFDHVWHLASLASPREYLDHPLETLESGSTGTRNMLRVAKRDGACFLLTSTSECYGDPLEHPQVETYWGQRKSGGPAFLFTTNESKLYAEALTMGPITVRQRCADQHRANFQYLRPAHGVERWACCTVVPGSGTARRTAHHFWRRNPNAQLLLCHRFSRWLGFGFPSLRNAIQ